MTNSIEILTRLLFTSLTPGAILSAREIKQEALQTAAELQIRFMAQYHASLKKKLRVRFVRSVQAFCVQMADLLEEYGRQLETIPRQAKANQPGLSFYRELQQILLSTLDYLEKHFGHEMDREQGLPRYRQVSFDSYLDQKISWLNGEEPKNIDQGLIQLLSQIPVINKPEIKYTYAFVIFWQTIFSALQTDQPLSTDTWISILISHNFNEAHFVDYLINYWSDAIPEHAGKASAIQYWLQQMYRIENGCYVNSVSGYQTGTHCKQMILNAIENKISALTGMESPDHNRLEETIETNLSVSQLGLFLRLQVDANMIQKENKTALIRQIAAHYRTTRVTQISQDNLYKKFYTCDPASVSILRTYLVNMLNLLKTY